MDLYFDPEHDKAAYFSFLRYRSLLHYRFSYLLSRLSITTLIFLALAIPCFYFALRHPKHDTTAIAAIFAAVIIFAVFIGSYLALLAWELNYVTRLGKRLFIDRSISPLPEFELKPAYDPGFPSIFPSFNLLREVLIRISRTRKDQDKRRQP